LAICSDLPAKVANTPPTKPDKKSQLFDFERFFVDGSQFGTYLRFKTASQPATVPVRKPASVNLRNIRVTQHPSNRQAAT
jgi:hypothetical protein